MSKCLAPYLTQHWSFPETFSSTISFELPSAILGAMSSSILGGMLGPFPGELFGAIPFKIPVTIPSAMSASIPGAIPSTNPSKIPSYFPIANFDINPGAISNAMLNIFLSTILGSKPGTVAFKIYSVILGIIPRSILSAMLDVF